MKVVWLALLCVAGSSAEYIFGKLEVGGPDFVIETPGYPSPAPSDSKRDYSIKALDSSAKIKLSCSEIRLPESKPCKDDKLYVFNGETIDEICGTKSSYETTTSFNRLSVTITTGRTGGGAVRCIAKAVASTGSDEEDKWENFLNFQSHEVDSSEAGLGGASKTTSCPCGSTNKARIVGGKETLPNEYPFMVGLINIDIMFLFCGATIITNRHAITAAHCTHNRQDDNLGVLIGYHDITEKIKNGWRKKNLTNVVNVTKYVPHEDYDPKTYHNDISLLVLAEELQYTTTVKPVCLPAMPIELVGQDIKVIGWGRLGTKEEMATVLMKVTLRVMPIEVCRDKFKQVRRNVVSQLCTYGHDKDSCTGDSGGPVVWLDPETNRYTLVGLVSYGSKRCASKDNPAVNTLVSYYLDWIQNKIRETSVGMRTCAKVG